MTLTLWQAKAKAATELKQENEQTSAAVKMSRAANEDRISCHESGDAVGNVCHIYGNDSQMCRGAMRQHDAVCLRYGQDLQDEGVVIN